MIAGCVTAPGDGDTGTTDRTIAIGSTDDLPDIPVRPRVDVTAAKPTASSPPGLRVTITNQSDHRIGVGEERAIVFAYVHSEERPGLVLLPAPAADDPAVRRGCWRLAEPIAIAEYYGVVGLDPGESTDRELGVWGGPELTTGCLPTGTFRFRTTYRGGPSERAAIDAPEWEARWGFTIEVS